MSNEIAQQPAVGMGATLYGYSDRQAFTVVEVLAGGKKVVVQRDKATLLNGCNSGEPDALKFAAGGFCGHMSGQQRYSYEAQPNATRRTFSLRKNGRFIEQGASLSGSELIVGKRVEFYDFNF